MNTKSTGYSKINTLEDLQRQKLKIRKKIKIREKLIDKHLKELNEDISAQYVIDQTFRLLKTENPFNGAIGGFAKSFLFRKQIIVPLLSGIATAFGISWLMKKFS